MAGARRGPAPKTKAQRELDGSRKTRAKSVSTVLEPVESIERPAWLDGYAVEFWDRYVPILSAARILTDADIPSLEAAARAYARWREIDGKISSGEIPLTLVGKKGAEYVNPMLYVRDIAEKSWRTWCKEFGLTPMSRRGVAPIEQMKTKSNPIEDRLKVIG